jgi:spermidine/putrescine transport system substrate-binding protein
MSLKKMKKNNAFSVMVGVALAVAAGCGTPEREKVLKVCTLLNNMDKQLVKEFEVEYAQQSGISDFRVEHTDFTDDVQVIDAIRNGMDYDITNKLDYAIGLMAEDGLLMPLDHAQLDMSVYEKFLVAPYYDTENKYHVPYTWGTFGLLYNPTHEGVNHEDMKSWSVLWNPKYKDKILMKGNFNRELFSIGVLYSFRKQLQETSGNFHYPVSYPMSLAKLLTSLTTVQIDVVNEALVEQRKLEEAYASFTGTQLMKNNAPYDVGTFWNCESGQAMQANPDLWYVVPQEGTILHINCLCIPAHSGNPKAAHAFIKFMSRKDNAKRNILTTGTASGVKAANDELKAEMEAGKIELPDRGPEWKAMLLDDIFPSEETLKRCCLANYTKPHLDIIDAIMTPVTGNAKMLGQ